MQLNKSIKIFINYFLGPLLFAWLAYSIYRQISHQPRLTESWLHIRQSFNSWKITYLFLAFVLIPVNWGLEAWKWKISVQHIYPVRFLPAFKAVLSGVSFSVTMPNRVGEYVGRVMYLPEGNRLKTISVTLVGSFAQLLVTLFAGTVGLLILKNILLEHFPQFRIGYQFVIYSLLIALLLLVLIYFNVSAIVPLFKKWIRGHRYDYLVEALQQFHQRMLTRLLLISALRYLVFISQYLLAFNLFEVNVPIGASLAVMSVVFLAMAVVPSIALVEAGLRGEISIRLMGLFSANTLGIGFTSITIWFINLILPAVIGSILLLNLRVFKKNNEDH